MSSNKSKLEKIKEQEKVLRENMARLFNSDEGIVFLKHLKKMCGQDLHGFERNKETGELMTNSLIYNEARRSVYLDIRKKLTPEILSLVERKES